MWSRRQHSAHGNYVIGYFCFCGDWAPGAMVEICQLMHIQSWGCNCTTEWSDSCIHASFFGTFLWDHHTRKCNHNFVYQAHSDFSCQPGILQAFLFKENWACHNGDGQQASPIPLIPRKFLCYGEVTFYNPPMESLVRLTFAQNCSLKLGYLSLAWELPCSL